MGFTTTQLTLDTDDGRINSSPSTVVLPSGQQFSFYSKFLTTGKQSYSRITFTPPSFTVNVEAGTGMINGIPVSWLAGTLTAPQNSYSLVYVTSAGILGIGQNLTMNFLKDVILLAYVSSGNSSITRIYELERTGQYIYLRRQTLVGSTWEWNDYEELLNTGSNPMCFYSSTTGLVYLNYTKDNATYVREFNPVDELTWELLQNITITSGNITLNRNPENTITVAGNNSGYKTYVLVESNEFPLGVSGFSFSNNQPYVFLPVLGGSYLQYIVSAITYEFFRMEGSSYILEASYTLNKNSYIGYSDRYRLWTGTTGTKYVGVRLFSTLFSNAFVTSPSNYGSFELYDYPSKTVLNASAYNTDAKDNMLFGIVSSGYKSTVATVTEYTETRDFEFETVDTAVSSGYMSMVALITEYTETRDFESDSVDTAISSGYKIEITVNSLPIT